MYRDVCIQTLIKRHISAYKHSTLHDNARKCTRRRSSCMLWSHSHIARSIAWGVEQETSEAYVEGVYRSEPVLHFKTFGMLKWTFHVFFTVLSYFRSRVHTFPDQGTVCGSLVSYSVPSLLRETFYSIPDSTVPGCIHCPCWTGSTNNNCIP